jgi:hypothetical protein
MKLELTWVGGTPETIECEAFALLEGWLQTYDTPQDLNNDEPSRYFSGLQLAGFKVIK